jgi:hypothetical protein
VGEHDRVADHVYLPGPAHERQISQTL